MKEWDEMTPAERRVEVAKDVLKQLANGCTIAVHGRYLRASNYSSYDPPRFISVSHSLEQPCQACAIGSAVAAWARRVKLQKTWGGIAGDRCMDWQDLFDYSQLRMMEQAFDGQIAAREEKAFPNNKALWLDKGVLTEDEKQRAREFGKANGWAIEPIMHNIINNNGEFKP